MMAGRVGGCLSLFRGRWSERWIGLSVCIDWHIRRVPACLVSSRGPKLRKHRGAMTPLARVMRGVRYARSRV